MKEEGKKHRGAEAQRKCEGVCRGDDQYYGPFCYKPGKIQVGDKYYCRKHATIAHHQLCEYALTLIRINIEDINKKLDLFMTNEELKKIIKNHVQEVEEILVPFLPYAGNTRTPARGETLESGEPK